MWEEGDDLEEELQAFIHLMLMRKASDAHFFIREGVFHFQLRCLGKMEHQDDGLFDGRLFHYLKYIAHLDLGDLAKPQSGNFYRRFHGKTLQFRFSLLCTNEMQTGVLRLLDHSQFEQIEDICTDKNQQQILRSLCQGRQGLALFSGPTGSGKTTTLHVLLKEAAHQYHRQVISLEDPIEIYDEHYLQLQVNEKSGFTYEVGIEQLLRHDPDIIMIGEIRNEKTAQMAVRAALSGHSVFSTVHAKSCIEVFNRLQELGVDRQQLHAILTFVSTQRLIRQKQKMKRECIYEILYGEELERYCATNTLNKEHQTMEDLLKKAYDEGTITKETYEFEHTAR